jgi:hypothetical protein
MESAIFYNAFFNVAKPLVKPDILLAIQVLPDELIQMVGSFYDTSAIYHQDKYDRLLQLQAKLNARTTDEWLVKWSNDKPFYLPTLVKICGKTVKWRENDSKHFWVDGVDKRKPIDKIGEWICIERLQQFKQLLNGRIRLALPKLKSEGQTYTDMSGTQLKSKSCVSYQDGFDYGRKVCYPDFGWGIQNNEWVPLNGIDYHSREWESIAFLPVSGCVFERLLWLNAKSGKIRP